ncbi:MAG: hypothetical protein Q9212_004679, partial [Teloschistes hypoglaucus]
MYPIDINGPHKVITGWPVTFVATLYLFAVTSTSFPTLGNVGVSPISGRDSENPLNRCLLGPGQDSHRVGTGPSPLWPYQIFKSVPFNPPVLNITSHRQKLAPGLLFLTPSDFGPPSGAAKEVAPIIMTDSGELVWNGPSAEAADFQVITYKGRPTLLYWSGISSNGVGYGNITFLDTSYNEILTLCPQLNLTTPSDVKYACEAGIHEASLTDRNTLLIDAYNVTRADLSSVGGPVHGWVYDNLILELDPESGAILYRWSALEHVPVNETKQPLAGSGRNQSQPFDWFHLSSIVQLGDGLLVSSRHTWTVFHIGPDSKIRWRLQGATGGDFGPLPANAQFVSFPKKKNRHLIFPPGFYVKLMSNLCAPLFQAWQHHARAHHISNTSSTLTLTLFNNANSYPYNLTTNPSTGLELHLSLPPNPAHHPPTLLKRLQDPSHPIYAGSQGSYQTLPHEHHSLLNYGQVPIVQEYNNADGEAIWTAQYGTPNRVQGYRAFKQEWHATPTTAPDLT